MQRLQKLIEEGWRLEIVKDDLESDRPFHAQVFSKQRGSGHHFLGKTLKKALDGLEEYVSQDE